MNQTILECKNICFSYHNLNGETKALTNISFQVNKGEFLAIVGPSGCGKSTLLSIIARLLEPESGEIIFHEQENLKIGYMLQQDHLLEWRTIWKNILLGPEITKALTKQKEDLALKLLSDYGLLKFKDKKPSELSGGMKQRVMIAIALVSRSVHWIIRRVLWFPPI